MKISIELIKSACTFWYGCFWFVVIFDRRDLYFTVFFLAGVMVGIIYLYLEFHWNDFERWVFSKMALNKFKVVKK